MKLPKGWKISSIDALVADLETGVSVTGADMPASDNEFGVLKVSAVSNGRFHPEQNKRIIGTELERATAKPKKGSILVSRCNTLSLVGDNALVRIDYDNLYLPDKLWQLKFRDDACVDVIWLSQVLQTRRVRTQLLRLATGTSGSMKNISKESFMTLEIAQPPLPEQRKIADILSTWDAALEKLDDLIAVKERRKKGLMQQLLTGEKRVKGFSKKWLFAKLGTLFNERVEQNRKDLPLLAITASKGVVSREDLAKRDTSSEDKSKYLRIAPGDIGYNTMRMWQGVSALSSLEGLISPAYTVCVPSEKIDGRFAAHFFKLPHTIHLFHRHSQGLVDDTLNLKYPNFATIEVRIPSDIEEQCAIADILDASDEELRLLRTQRAAIDQQKRGLMQRLLTGAVRVRTEKYG
jgi:type I restriction enzyme, S subunit